MTNLTRRLALTALIVFAPAALAAQQAAFTLDQVMSPPFPDELVAAPRGGAVAWVFKARGARNIWVAAPPDYRGKAITSYPADHGQELTDLRWTPDGRAIVYVRGGGANGKGEQLIHARGSARSLRWSPDGAALAFVSDRGDHAFIAVYDVATKALRFPDPSVDADAEPGWSPAGRRIAFVRTPAGADGLPFTPQRAGQPWSIRVLDVASGAGRPVWVADTGRGSVFREIVAPNQIVWGGGDRIVFAWEQDGWTHLYAVPVSGGRATLLTPGAFEVEHVAASPDGATIVYSSNQDDIERRHIWKVAVTGGPPTALTRGTDLEWTPVVTGDGQGVELY